MPSGISTSRASPLETRIEGTRGQRFTQELFRNSGQFPVANLLLELLLEGPSALLAPDLYALVGAALLQAWFLAGSGANGAWMRFGGNLIGPAAYTAVSLAIEGTDFFSKPHHMAYWGFAATIGLLQAARCFAKPGLLGIIVVLENVVRAEILFALYAIFEALSAPDAFSIAEFFADSAHVYIGLATVILGVTVGLASRTEQSYLELLRDTSAELRRYSEWLLGAELLERVIADPSALSLTRRERTILFMDVRGFTAWSERCSPEQVVQALNEYYAASEPVLRRHGVIKLKFSADEVLGVFASPRDAAAGAVELRAEVAKTLSRWGLGAGIGVHSGPVIEGLLGSVGVMAYDVIGDTVNTGKRIEGAASGGEVIVSGATRAGLDPHTPFGPQREVIAKGKAEPITVYPLLDRA